MTVIVPDYLPPKPLEQVTLADAVNALRRWGGELADCHEELLKAAADSALLALATHNHEMGARAQHLGGAALAVSLVLAVMHPHGGYAGGTIFDLFDEEFGLILHRKPGAAFVPRTCPRDLQDCSALPTEDEVLSTLRTAAHWDED